MTTHLTPDEFVTALEGGADGRVSAHLAACDACRAELDALAGPLRDVASVDVPEPSPLFWDHFARRVREATVDAPAPAPAWWIPRRLVWTVGLAVVAVVLAVGLAWRAPGPTPEVVAEATDVADDPASVVAFDDVVGALEAMAPDEVDVFAPTGATTWAMVDDLTDAERVAFVRLVEREMEALP